MFSFFLSCTSSIFIPYSLSDFPSLNAAVSQKKFAEITQTNKTIIGIAMSKNHRKIKIIPNAFYTASTIYGTAAEFVILDENFSSQVSQEEQLQLPILILYRNSTKIATFHYPETDNQFLFLMKSLFSKNEPELITNTKQLYPLLGNSPFTILCTQDFYQNAKSLQIQASNQMEMINIIIIDPNTFTELGFPDAHLALFRNEDRTIVRISNDLNVLLFASYPIARTLTKGDIIESDEIIVCIATNRYSDPLKECLYEVGAKYDEFIVGFLGPRLFSFPEELMNKRLQRGKNVLVFSWKNNFYYDTSSVFSQDFLKLPFNQSEYMKKFDILLQDILHGKIQPTYVSEPIPQENNNSVSKVVGKTYSYFINDPNHDTLVFFMREDCAHCAHFEKVFKDFADECRQNNLDWLKFGEIDITKNSCETPYPFMTGVPLVYIFPKNISNRDWLKGGKDRMSLIRFINRRGSSELPFFEEPLDSKKSQMEMVNLISTMRNYPPKEQNLIRRYVMELGKELGINKSPEQLENEMKISNIDIEEGKNTLQYDEI